MKLDCSFLEIIRSDFSALWKCKQHAGAVEIATPYLYPQSKFVRVFLTQRDDRYIVTEDGDIGEFLRELLPHEEFFNTLDDLATDSGLKRGTHNGKALYFKDCTDPKLITSLILDVASFAVKSANVIFSASEFGEEETEKEKRFKTEANEFIKSLVPTRQIHTNYVIRGVPDVRFNTVIEASNKLWIVSYIGGRTLREFRMKTSDVADSFAEAWASESRDKIQATIPVMNNHDDGYDPDKLMGRFMKLQKEARQPWITWTNRELVKEHLDLAA